MKKKIIYCVLFLLVFLCACEMAHSGFKRTINTLSNGLLGLNDGLFEGATEPFEQIPSYERDGFYMKQQEQQKQQQKPESEPEFEDKGTDLPEDIVNNAVYHSNIEQKLQPVSYVADAGLVFDIKGYFVEEASDEDYALLDQIKPEQKASDVSHQNVWELNHGDLVPVD